ncbi:DNA repair protein XRCC2 homolog isoform X6 [Hevea brasiliensis]|uniref:DNA repair protein XRCC2 homolog isoform X6 n=1 Tax=Hevea brasiliensis TaxID=3981 RepID=UPI0025E855D0|nr:DNA repair protein XRCC2 homolog isoform X6 [Hevea brasiliensis]
MLVIAAKATILGNRYAANEVKWNLKRPFSPDSAASSVTNKVHQLMYREYMPSIWQSFVTLRILIQASEWLMPPLSFGDSFIVKDAGVFCVS